MAKPKTPPRMGLIQMRALRTKQASGGKMTAAEKAALAGQADQGAKGKVKVTQKRTVKPRTRLKK